jgi:hypothetical protein
VRSTTTASCASLIISWMEPATRCDSPCQSSCPSSIAPAFPTPPAGSVLAIPRPTGRKRCPVSGTMLFFVRDRTKILSSGYVISLKEVRFPLRYYEQ